MASGFFRTSIGVSVTGFDLDQDGLGDLLIGTIDTVSGDYSVVAILGDAGGYDAVFDVSTADSTNSVIMNGAAPDAKFGWSIANLGNVNGTGGDDLAIVSRDAGTVRVVFDPDPTHAGYTTAGTMDVFAAPTSGMTITGLLAPSEQISVVGLGDVNGDGTGDFAISSAAADGGNGEVYVVYGDTAFGATLDVSALDGTNGFKVSGAAELDAAGTAISGANFNGDNYSDLVFSMPGHDTAGADAGRVVVLFGNSSTAFPAIVDIDLIASTDPDDAIVRYNGVVIDGVATSDLTGFAIAGTGDFNDDGKDDLLIAAPDADPNGFASGTVYVVYGNDSGSLNRIDLSVPSTDFFAIHGTAAQDRLGSDVANLGDVTGDGVDDIGALTANGDLFIYNAAGQIAYTFSNIFAEMPETLELAGISDINSDAGSAINDIAITATFTGGSIGETFVILGGAANFAALDAADGATDGRTDFAAISNPVEFVENNTAIVVTGDKTGTVTEDTTAAVTGDIGVTDSSSPTTAPTFANATAKSALGMFVVNGGGDIWSYTISNNAVLQDMDADDSIIDKATFIADNGATHTVTITINGVDDAAQFVGDTGLAISEDLAQGFGSVNITDVDADDVPLLTGVTAAGQHGHIVFGTTAANGDTSYTYFLTDAALQDLDTSETATDSITVVDSDQNSHAITVTINGLTEGTSSIDGDSGDNILMASYGNDVINGFNGADTINGGGGNDQQNGGGGNDTIFDALGNDTVDGGEGHDRVNLLSGNNSVTGGEGSDFIKTGFQQDTIDGGAGDDVIAADAGAVFLFGNDRITGGTGNDLMSGGSGIDTFVFRPNDGVDTIAQFNVSAVTFDSNTGFAGAPRASDFQVGIDKIELSGFANVNASNVMDFINDPGANGARFVAEGTTINFHNVLTSALDSDDFIFV